jgi:proteasome lid subunit RPN8/RPN11
MDIDPQSSDHEEAGNDSEPVSTAAGDGAAAEKAGLQSGMSDPAVAALLDAADQGTLTGSANADSDALLRAAITIRPVQDAPPLDPDHPQFQAIMRQSVLEQISAHAAEFPTIEVCGVMVGSVYESPQASFVYVDSMIRGEASAARSTAVTFTAETWQHIHREMEEKYQGKKIIGWYHTHPGFGIFLSEMDLFIQRHFFNAPWQMAFVLDPNSCESGMFAWRAAQVRRVEVVMDDETSGKMPSAAFPSLPNLSAQTVFAEEPSAPVNNASIEELVHRVRVLESRLKLLWAAFAILAAVAIIWPLLVPLMLPNDGANQPPPQTRSNSENAKESSPMLPLR